MNHTIDNFKAFYLHHVCPHIHGAFPRLVRYGHFVELIPSTLIPLCAIYGNAKDAVGGMAAPMLGPESASSS